MVYRALRPYLSLVTLVRTIAQGSWHTDPFAPFTFTLRPGLRWLGYWFLILGTISHASAQRPQPTPAGLPSVGVGCLGVGCLGWLALGGGLMGWIRAIAAIVA